MSRAIDTMHLGRPHVICAFQLDGVVIDPGPATVAEHLIDELGEPPRALLLTHIHLDHAGGAGVLARAFPSLQVYVHERGAPHVVDPAKLVASAERLYGDDMERLWGEVAPVPAERVHALAGGETVEGLLVAHTPGHASHHVCYLDQSTGEAYVGDVAGVRMPGETYTLPPTVPPEFDLDAWMRSLDTVEGWNPEAVCITHFGRFTDVGEQLDRARASLVARAERARVLPEGEFERWSEEETRAALPADAAESLLQAAPPETLGVGLRRYWERTGA